MKIVDKEMFEIAQSFANDAVKTGSKYCWMCALESLKMAYGL
ncbi:HEPN domain-containing protein [Escherichia phage vB_EcoS-UDF157lw]|uniref:HEPN domain-containing protein n=1 Tax=Escherichia phage vB_EcoS-UDF157lw TaxID=3024423 RepID=A0AAE9XK42_9CAUD|nr:HEPN domain-containing protein [Escherichia phage vB_EcoS-UDF157lw]